MTNWVHVAVGVVRNKSNRILIAKRPQRAHQGGLWEFPGGKVEPGESVTDALSRELQEEIGITPIEFFPLIQIRHHYPDKSVLLDVWEVTSFNGEAHGREGQPIEWVMQNQLSDGGDALYPLPDANFNIVKAIQLPNLVAVSGDFSNLSEFEARLAGACHRGAGMIYLRSHRLLRDDPKYLDCAAKICSEHNVLLQVAKEYFTNYISVLRGYSDAIIGVHLKSNELDLFSRDQLPQQCLVGASCHNATELKLADDLGIDYVFLSPVKKTNTHPDAEPLGWDRFRCLVAGVNTPVYALGGLSMDDLGDAKSRGAGGVAGVGMLWG